MSRLVRKARRLATDIGSYRTRQDEMWGGTAYCDICGKPGMFFSWEDHVCAECRKSVGYARDNAIAHGGEGGDDV